MSKYKESVDMSSECQIFGIIPKYIYIHGLYRYILYGSTCANEFPVRIEILSLAARDT